MKKVISLIFCMTFVYNLFSQNNLYNLLGEKVKVDFSKTTIAIAYSQSSCHSCYNDINKYLTKNNLFDSIQIIVFANIDKSEKEDMQIKRTLYDDMKKYFPTCENIYFNTKKKKGKPSFFSINMNEYQLPNLFMITNKKLKVFFPSSEAFLRYEMQANNF
jgi:hypothetical protein